MHGGGLDDDRAFQWKEGRAEEPDSWWGSWWPCWPSPSPSASRAADEQAKRDDRPERGIGIYTDFSGVVVPLGESVRMDLTVENKGKQDEVVDLKLVGVPKGWKASLKGGSFTVTGVAVPSGKTRSLAFSAEPEKGMGPGTYDFTIEGVTPDGKLKADYTIAVTTRERSRMGTEDIQVTTSYPVLRGQTDATFEFSLEVANKSENDRNFNLAAQAPEKWEVNFKPGYEAKQISSLRIKGGGSQTVAVSVTPARDAMAGEYPILVRISSGESKAEVKLMVVLTRHLQAGCGHPHGDPLHGGGDRQAHHGVVPGQEHRLGGEPQHQPVVVQARELEGGVQAREDRGPGARARSSRSRPPSPPRRPRWWATTRWASWPTARRAPARPWSCG